MKKYLVMLAIWMCICFLASTGHPEKEEGDQPELTASINGKTENTSYFVSTLMKKDR